MELSPSMGAPPVPDEIPLDEKGNIDVMKEMEFLNILKDAGVEVNEMEDLLFTDIEEYRTQRAELLALFRGEYEQSSIDDGQYAPSHKHQDEDLLLYGSPLKDEGDIPPQRDEIHLQSGPMEQKPENVNGDLLDLAESPIEQEDIVTSEQRGVSEHDIQAPLEDGIEGGYDREDRILRTHSTYRAKSIYFGILAVIVASLIAAGSYVYIIRSQNDNGQQVELTAEFRISDNDPVIGTILNLSATMRDEEAQYEWDIIPNNYRLSGGTE